MTSSRQATPQCAHGFDPGYWIEILIPGAPMTPNEIYGANKFKKHRNAVNWKQWVYLLARGHEPPQPLKKARIFCRRHGPRQLDFDGLVGSFKPVIDGLCTRKEKTVGLKKDDREILWSGILENDTWAITGPWIVDQASAPVGGEYVWIRIEEIDQSMMK